VEDKCCGVVLRNRCKGCDIYKDSVASTLRSLRALRCEIL